MMKRFFTWFIACLIMYVVPVKSFAWGLNGHRIVGQIAQFYLTPKAKENLAKILDGESVAMASNWPDFIKSDPQYNYLSSWHYINVDDSLSYAQMQAYLKQDTTTDAYTKLIFIIAELKNKALSKEKKAFYVKLLIHIVGDLHQPMHVSREEDQGGNKIKLFWFNEPTNLHRLWDEQLIEFQKLSYTEYANSINRVTTQQKATWQKQTISRWIYESYSISQQLYKEVKDTDQKLSYRYNFDHIATVNNQLLKGGVRLAALLNQLFG